MVKIDSDDRFWSKVNITNNGCWEWLAGKDQAGYGRFSYDGKNQHAHRIAWLLFYGSQPTDVVMHTCDNPSCVNPRHLRLGSQLDNISDRVSKGRCFHPHGATNSQAKLTEDQVNSIRREYQRTNCTKRSLARKYDMSDSAIGRIINGQTWS